MKVTVIGTGYVGLVAGTCFAHLGIDVMCMDLDEHKIALLESGGVPIYEPGLDDVIRSSRAHGCLHFTSDYDEAVDHGEIFLIAVGTPQGEDGGADLQHVMAVARELGKRIVRQSIIVNKSTVPVGTADKVEALISSILQERGADVPFAVVSNPEFLREGAAIRDFMEPDRIILGSRHSWAIERMSQLYGCLEDGRYNILTMDPASAELTKYAANAMLATRISFMNELSQLSMELGADIELVRRGIGSDPRIGPHFLYPGCGYGGSCFPKDVRALIQMAEQTDTVLGIVSATEKANDHQKTKLLGMLESFYAERGGTHGKTVALWGLAFKPSTDDIREAPSLVLIRLLLERGIRVRAYDPEAAANVARIFSDAPGLTFCTSRSDAITGSDALMVVTEWPEFRNVDLFELADRLTDRVVFDGRNIFNLDELAAAGLSIYQIGRRPRLAESQDGNISGMAAEYSGS